MKDCKWFEKFFSDYIDGELDSKMILELEEHLQNCPHCMKIIQRMKNITKQLHRLQPLEISNDFETILRTRIRVEMGLERNSWRPRLSGFSGKVPAYAFSLAFILLVITIISQKTSTQNPVGSVSPMSISQNASQLSNSKVIRNVRYELNGYNVYSTDYYNDTNQTKLDNYIEKTKIDSLQKSKELQKYPGKPSNYRVQSVLYTF